MALSAAVARISTNKTTIVCGILTGRELIPKKHFLNMGVSTMKNVTRPSMKQRAGKVVVRVIEVEQKTFDRVARRVGSLQARADKMVQKRVESAKWMPKEGKQLVSEWIHTMKKSRGDLRKAVDTSFDLSAEFVKRVSEPVAKSKGRKRATVARKKVVHHQPAAA